MNYYYANQSASDIVIKFMKMIDNSPNDIEELEAFYFKIERYFSSIANEMDKYGMRNKWEFSSYATHLHHETGRFAGNFINTLRNWFWYVRNNEKQKAESTRKTMLDSLYMFCLGVGSTEILYNEIFSKI
jgi:hypothetical protein